MLLAYATVISIGMIVGLYSYPQTSGWATPYLGGSDGEGYFDQATLLAQQGILNFQNLIRSNYLGYQIFLAVLFAVFGTHLVVGLIANAILLFLVTACLYRATIILTDSKRAGQLAALACMLTAPHAYYALVLLKEPAVSLAFALILLAVAKMFREDRFGFSSIAYVVIALMLIISMRATAMMFLIILFALIGTQLLKKRAHLFIVFLGAIVLLIPFAQQFSIYELDSSFLLSTVTENSVISDRFSEGNLDLTGIAGQLIGYYIRLPFAVKALFFSLPTVVQLLLPFDIWSNQFIKDHPSSFFFRNLNVLWLAIVLPWLLFSLLRMRQVVPPLVTRLMLAGVIYFVVIAIIYGGLIPRYAGQALLFIYPSIGYWWDRAQREERIRAASTRFFMHYYASFVVAALGYLSLQLLRG